MVLGIDTATAIASAALVEDGKLVAEAVDEGARPGWAGGPAERSNHAEVILPLLDRLLKGAAVSLPEISALGVSIGPGSFTGLRIGLSTVKGLAYGSETPVIGIPTLLAVAARVANWAGLICPFLDARKREVYAALFRRENEAITRLAEDLVSSPESVLSRVESAAGRGPCLFIGDGTRAYGDMVRRVLGSRATLTGGEDYPSIASAVARLAEKRLGDNEFDPLGPLAPLYLRPSEAELQLKGFTLTKQPS